MTEYTTPLCKTGEGSHREQWPVTLFCLLPAAGAIALLVLSLRSSSPLPTLLLSLPFILLCGVFCMMAWLEMQQLLGRCRITPDGITVTRPFAQDQHLSWNDFQQVCICKYVSGRGNRSSASSAKASSAASTAAGRLTTHSNTACSSPSTTTRRSSKPSVRCARWRSSTCATPCPTNKEADP